MERGERGQVLLGMTRALADDICKMIANVTAPERAQNPQLVDVLSACAAGVVFHELLAALVARSPEKDRAAFRAKILEYAENTAAGLPTSLPGAPRN